MNASNRTPREVETREMEQHQQDWAPPSTLPEPIKQDGWRYRWIRTAAYGNSDNANVSSKFRQGWVPVKAEEHPEIVILRDRNSQFQEHIEIGGLLLCKMPERMARQRNEYYRNLAERQLESVENNLMKESDPRMPLSKPDVRSNVTFGKGRGLRAK